ncbi:hypothetical protein N0V84_001441 [Fusarium piperis]|uniref:Uncharacterized protein n=1 Tax=Fusarium piperis TaxID=1435070 RepID=A0A9W8WKX0_9HYPO|nr:hypothetical protein N0V84_001441 [Fusarium piperis]
MPEAEGHSIRQQLSDIETLLRDLPGKVATVLASKWPEVIIDLGGRAAGSESHDLIADFLKPLTQPIQAELDTLRARINTGDSTSFRTPLPTERPKQAAPSATTHRAKHTETGSQPTTPVHDTNQIRIAPDDMGPRMTSTLEKLTAAHGFDQLFEVIPLPISVTADLSEVLTLEGDPDVKANRFMAAGDGVAHVFVADVEANAGF